MPHGPKVIAALAIAIACLIATLILIDRLSDPPRLASVPATATAEAATVVRDLTLTEPNNKATVGSREKWDQTVENRILYSTATRSLGKCRLDHVSRR